MSAKDLLNTKAKGRLLPLLGVLSAIILIPTSFVDVVDSSGSHLFNYFSLAVLLVLAFVLAIRLKSTGWSDFLTVFAFVLTMAGSLFLVIDIVFMMVG